MKSAFLILLTASLAGCAEESPWNQAAPWCPTSGLREWVTDVEPQEVPELRDVLVAHNWTQVLDEDHGHIQNATTPEGYPIRMITVTARCFDPHPPKPECHPGCRTAGVAHEARVVRTAGGPILQNRRRRMKEPRERRLRSHSVQDQQALDFLVHLGLLAVQQLPNGRQGYLSTPALDEELQHIDNLRRRQRGP